MIISVCYSTVSDGSYCREQEGRCLILVILPSHSLTLFGIIIALIIGIKCLTGGGKIASCSLCSHAVTWRPLGPANTPTPNDIFTSHAHLQAEQSDVLSLISLTKLNQPTMACASGEGEADKKRCPVQHHISRPRRLGCLEIPSICRRLQAPHSTIRHVRPCCFV